MIWMLCGILCSRWGYFFAFKLRSINEIGEDLMEMDLIIRKRLRIFFCSTVTYGKSQLLLQIFFFDNLLKQFILLYLSKIFVWDFLINFLVKVKALVQLATQ